MCKSTVVTIVVSSSRSSGGCGAGTGTLVIVALVNQPANQSNGISLKQSNTTAPGLAEKLLVL